MTPEPIERPGELIVRLIAATMAAGTAEVQLISEPTEPAAALGLERTLQGVVDFVAGRAQLRDGDRETLIIGGDLYRRDGSGPWTHEYGAEGGRTNLTDEGFGLLAFARGVQEITERDQVPAGGFSLTMRVTFMDLFDDQSASDILGVPTALIGLDALAKLRADDQDRVTSFAIENEKRRRMKVARRRFRLELGNFGLPVQIEPPDPTAVVKPRRRRSWFAGARRKLGYPMTR
jgi:hypothetical protein